MTNKQILSALKNNNGCMEYTALLNLNITDTCRDPLADEARIEQLLKDNLLNGKADAYCHISITKKGRLYLQDTAYFEDHNKQLADKAANDNAKKNIHEWRLTVGGALISGIVGLAFELMCFFFL